MFRITLFLFILITNQAIADDFLVGKKSLNLVDIKGKHYEVGSLTFITSGQKISYKLQMNHSAFKDFFLSMKEMKCLEGPELWCHLAYPYDNPRTVTGTDLRWLAHDLLFMYKKKSEFGANFYQGIYYQLTLNNDRIIGIAQAVDLNMISAPPDDLTKPPITSVDVDEIDAINRWLPTLVIK